MTLPRKEFLSQGEIANSDCGISVRDVLKAVESGILKRVVFPGRTRGKYRRIDVVYVFALEKVVKSEVT
jgi:hypothetical protein